jgi:thioredoxin reductase
MTNDYDVVIVGGSAAGLSAALLLGRSRRRVLVIDDERPINATVDHSHGFFSRDGIAPHELMAIARADLAPYDVTIRRTSVVRVIGHADAFTIHGATDVIATARRVVLATGMRIDLPDIPGLADTWGKGSASCPYCHGWEVRDQPLAVLAVSHERAEHLVTMLGQWSGDVTVHDPEHVASVEHDGAGNVQGLVQHDGTRRSCSAVFVALLPHLDTTLLDGLGADLGPDGWPLLDTKGETSVPGVWCAGNVADQTVTLIGAAASGARAGMMVNADLVLASARLTG